MDNTSKVTLIRKMIRRDKPFFSGSINGRYFKFDYEIYGVSYSKDYYYDNRFKLNVRVSNVERAFWGSEFKPPTIYDVGDVRRINKQVRVELENEWRGFFMTMFDINRWDFEIGDVIHMNLKKY